MMTVSTSSVLRQASARIRNGGWAQGSGVGTRECVVTAIQGAANDLHAQELAIEAVKAFHGFLGEHPTDWNDRKGQTQPNVMRGLTAAADALDGR